MSSLFSTEEHQYMALAMELAKKGRFTTSPNPNVGCVVVKNGRIIGQGWHKKAGTGHAEVNALAELTYEQSQDATAFVTLEPCSHFGRTPPCAERLIEAGITEVVIAMLDTNPLVSGNGVNMLMQAGIKVRVGLLEQDARALNNGFFTRMEMKRPFVQVKMASSLDGKIALANGESKWITGSKARADVQKFRALSCAILSTAQTVLADDAKLNVRADSLAFDYPLDEINHNIRQPHRIILDSKNQITHKHLQQLALFQSHSPITLVRIESTGEFAKLDYVKEVTLPYHTEGKKGFDLPKLLTWCAQQEFNSLWVESGSTLAASFVEQKLFDELIVYIAPKIMGANAKELLPVGPFTEMNQNIQLSLLEITHVGEDLRLSYIPDNKS